MTELAGPFGSSGCFCGLSDELVIKVLHFCSYEEILRFAATRKRYHNIVANSVSLRLHIELEVNGLEIIKGTRKGNATYSVLLDELVRYRDAWLNLTLEGPTERTLMERDKSLLWELREGSYTVAFSSTPDTLLDPDTLWVSPFDHPGDPNPVAFRDHFHAFTSDLEQDLVALLKVDPDQSVHFFFPTPPRTNRLNTSDTHLQIRLCSATTGLAHPLAQNSKFIVQVDVQVPDPGAEPEAIGIEIMDNIFAARVSDLTSEEYEILAWDWKSGALLLRIGSKTG
ncbi:hypothetical protein FRC11_014385 [Ceratobasidium sp. 423]|nr:hypothetical protein FRC11_014385 [Ceratobasidium sp. 423]